VESRADARCVADDAGSTGAFTTRTSPAANRVPMTGSQANTWAIVAADGTKQAYTFGYDCRRELPVKTLRDQLRGAGGVGPLRPFDASARDSR
jgi:hypothetical protein